MSDMNVVSSLPTQQQAQIFSKEIGDKVYTSSILDQISGPVIHQNGEKMLPQSIVMSDSSELEGGAFMVSYPWMGKFTQAVDEGYHNFEGLENKLDVRTCSAFWQTESFSIPKSTVWSLNGRQELKFYNFMTKSQDRLHKTFKERNDFNFKKAIVEGFSSAILNTDAWDGTGFESFAPAALLHPNIYVNVNATGATRATWSNTDSTYRTNVTTLADAGTTSDYFGGAALDRLVDLILELGGADDVMGSGATHLGILTPGQYNSLFNEDSVFLKKFSTAYQGKPEMNPLLKHSLGVYRDILFLIDQRAPVWNINSGAGTITYVNETTATNEAGSNVAKAPRVIKGAANANTGTMEIAIGLGAKALIKMGTPLTINEKQFNYNTSAGALAIRMQGLTRYEAKKSGVQSLNESSLLFLTPTVAV